MKVLLNEKYNSMLNYLAQLNKTKPHLVRIKLAISAYKINKCLNTSLRSALENVELLSKFSKNTDNKGGKDSEKI